MIGITDYAQEQLGDVVYVELPPIGRRIEQGKEAAVVESVKAASEVYAPVSGEVAEVNEALAADPATVNADPMGDGWFLKMRLDDPEQLDAADGRGRLPVLCRGAALMRYLPLTAARPRPRCWPDRRRLDRCAVSPTCLKMPGSTASLDLPRAHGRDRG